MSDIERLFMEEMARATDRVFFNHYDFRKKSGMERNEWDHTELPNGSYLFWKTNEAGGRTYYTDENHVETVVWDTCLCAPSTLLAALVQEERLQYEEAVAKGRGYRE